jgi:hypothetical protein
LRKKLKFGHSLIFSSPKKISSIIFYDIIALPWAMAFLLLKHLFCLSHCKN